MSMDFHRRYEPLPETRDKIPSNHLPISRTDINHLAQVYGEDIAENIRITAQEVRRRGGINPQATQLIIPEGKQGPINEEELFRIAGSLAIWWSHGEATF